MPKKNAGCRIVTGHTRPDTDLISRFKDLPIANIDDCMNRVAAVHQDIRPMNKAPLLGSAFTVKVPQGDNLMFHKAMDMAEKGDIIVIDAGGMENRAIFGELMINYCRLRGLGGVIVDGTIRDFDTISKLDFPVYARGISPNGPYKNGPGEIGTVINFGGQTVRPGDIIAGDEDGIIVIKPEDAAEIADQAKAIFRKESTIMETMEMSGDYIRPWVNEKLEELGCEYVQIKD